MIISQFSGIINIIVMIKAQTDEKRHIPKKMLGFEFGSLDYDMACLPMYQLIFIHCAMVTIN